MEGAGLRNVVKIDGEEFTMYHCEKKKSVNSKSVGIHFDCLYTDRVNTVSVTIMFPEQSISAMMLLKAFFDANSTTVGFDRNTEIAGAHVTPFGCTFMTSDKKIFNNILAVFKWMATKKLSERMNKKYFVNYHEIRKMLRADFKITVVGKCKLFYDSLVGKVPARKKKLDEFVEKLNAIPTQTSKADDKTGGKTFPGIVIYSTAQEGADGLYRIMLALQDMDIWYDARQKAIMSHVDCTHSVAAIIADKKRLSDSRRVHEKRFGTISPITKQQLQQKMAVALFHVRGCTGPTFAI